MGAYTQAVFDLGAHLCHVGPRVWQEITNECNVIKFKCVFHRIQLGGNELPKALVEPEAEESSDDEDISPEERGTLSVLKGKVVLDLT